MADLGSQTLGRDLQFYATTTNPATGAAADASSGPNYRVYEEATGVALLTGAMAKLDDPNTTGFYTASIALTAANGFERDKDYVIYIEAVVGGVTGVTHHRFQVEAAPSQVSGGGGGTITFAALLKELAYLTGAVAHEGTAEAGSATSLDDTALIQADDYWNGFRVYIFEGTGLGQERVINDFTAASDRITPAPDFAPAPDTSSKFIILNKEWTVGELRNAFLVALRQRRRFHLTRVVNDTLVMDTDPSTIYAYTVPAGFYTVQHILREEAAGEGNFVYEIPSDWWYIDRTAREIVFDKTINDFEPFIKDGYALRLIGQQMEQEPDADSDTLTIPTGNLLFLAAAIALDQKATRDVRDRDRFIHMADRYRQQFDARADITPAFPGAKRVDDT